VRAASTQPDLGLELWRASAWAPHNATIARDFLDVTLQVAESDLTPTLFR
jgi:hypothetical protein